jgi:hypothetical protein
MSERYVETRGTFCLPLGNQLDYHTIKSKEQETRRGSCAVGIGNMRRDE